MRIEHNLSLLPYNTFSMDVCADTAVFYGSQDELSELIRTSGHALPKPFLHIGSGSNLLFMNDFGGTVLMSEIKDVSVLSHDTDNVIVRVGAGWVMDDFVSYAVRQGWYGLENLSGIPGQAGAGAVQNIGAYGVELGDCVRAVNCISLEDGTPRTFLHEECAYAYRYSIFKSPEYRGRYAVVGVDLCLHTAFVPNVDYGGIRQNIDATGKNVDTVSAEELREIIIRIRNSKLPDPKVLGNAGSFFMNPVVARSVHERIMADYPGVPGYRVGEDRVKIPAAWLIEQCGWKGKSLGKAGVHASQPLVLVNLGNACGNDIRALSDRIQADVYEKFGISIRPEVNFIS